MRPLRVLITSGTYPPEIGGPSRYLPPLLSRLKARGHHVEVVTFGVPAGIEADEWPVRRISRRLPLPARLARFAFTTARAARRADLVFAVGQALPSSLAARMAGRPLLLRIVGDLAWEHSVRRGATSLGVDEFQTARLSGRARLARALHRRAARRARLVLVPGRYLAGIVAGWGIPPERIRVIPNASAPETRRERPNRDDARRETGMSGSSILAVGRLVPWKGFDDLLRAVARLPGDVEARLDILGEGPEDAVLRALARDLRIEDRVVFHGAVERPRVDVFLAAADVLALPSTYEGLSHVLLEAMDAGCPAVTTRAAGNPEVVRDGSEGLLVDPGDVAGLAGALERVLRDDALRRRLALGAKARAGDFPYEGMVDATETLVIEAAGA
jgi:glycosyltransferase involved in cell wall biosynthesis